MSAPTVPNRYLKRTNDFPGGGTGGGVGGFTGGGMAIEDEGNRLPDSRTLNYTGGLVRARYNGASQKIDVTVASRTDPATGEPAAPGDPGSVGLEHSELDGLRWKLSGHTGGAFTIAGFRGDGTAKEYPQARNTPAAHGVAMTGGSGLLAYAICPPATLENIVMALSVMAS